MGMADIRYSDDHGSYTLFHPSTEKMTHDQMDTISGLNNCKILEIIDHSSSIKFLPQAKKIKSKTTAYF